MGLWILLALHLAATALAFAYLWRRQRSLSGEIEQLRETLAQIEAGRAAEVRRLPRRAEQGAAAPAETGPAKVVTLAPESPTTRAARAWRRLPDAPLRFDAISVAPDTGRGLILGAAAAAPALGFFFGLDPAALVVAGLGVAAAMMLLGLRDEWRAAAWAGVITAIAWAAIGFVLGAAQAASVPYGVFVAFAGLAGLAHAHLRSLAPGAAMALSMALAALGLGAVTSMIGPAGAAFATLTAAAAVLGAARLRLEPLHVGAFGAALAGLFVLSGQDAAAIWFTPATAWAGALFLGVAAVRAPQLGPRALVIAGLGALAPLLALGALHLSQHGLSDRFAAAGAFIGSAAALSGVLAAAAQRRPGGLAGLKLTAWVLAIGAFTAIVTAILLAAPAPLAAPVFAALALMLTAINTQLPHACWRLFACVSGLLASLFALASADMLLNEAPNWPAWALIGLALALPSALMAGASMLSHRAEARFSAGVFEGMTFTLAVIGANLAVRLYFSGGAMLLQPVGFVETGAHVAVWLLAALLIASGSRRGSAPVRIGLATVLGLLALMLSGFAGGLWLTSYWSTRAAMGAPLTHAPLGFLFPAILFWAHWVFWRARGDETPTRVAIAAAALLTAAYVTLELMRWPNAPEWVGALGGAIAFALAIVINFAPGVTYGGRGSSYREEKLHRHRRRKQRV